MGINFVKLETESRQAGTELILLEQLKKYGLNPSDWTLDWSHSTILSERPFGLAQNIHLVRRDSEDVTFIGKAYWGREGVAKVADWFKIEMPDEF